MLIPIKCFTCGKVLANKYHYYLKQVYIRKEKNGENTDEIEYLDTDNDIKKSIEGIVLDELFLTDVCCRRHMLTHVDIF